LKAAEKIKEESDVLVVIGIGGSYLGAKAPISTGPIMIHPPILELIITTIISKLKSHKTQLQLASPKSLN
jgi:hypothetical protein